MLWIEASTLFNLSAIAALLKAYEGNGFGLAYPVCRAISVLLVTLLAAALWGETLSMAGLAGVGLIAAALLLLALGGRGDGAAHAGGLGWIAISGSATAIYVLCDAHGVRQSGSPLAYGFALSCVNGAVMCGVHRMRGGTWGALARHPLATVLNAVAALASYLLILWVWTGAATAPATALRDTSAIFALILAVLWLREPFTTIKLAAILLAATAAPLLRFA
jgi:multidrug transporter EmrE-like cation transporter